MVQSRIFSYGKDNDEASLVPMADMLNHSNPASVTFKYCDKQNGFVMSAIKDLKRGE
jgi:hypothetical protein